METTAKARSNQYFPQPISRRWLMDTLGFRSGKMPAEHEDLRIDVPVHTHRGKLMRLVTIQIRKSWMPNKAHRIFVHCPCGKWVPFGRAAQHKCN